MNETCGCCEGVEILTPEAIANRPGLDALAYRVGTYASFLETMIARLSNYYLDIPRDVSDEQGRPVIDRLYPLRGLTTRESNDPSIALLDTWATVGDVLTFYQERIANEGYLRTATERRSILELARLVGYALRPGVAASVYLAYTLDENSKEPVTIPAGARVQSVPGPGELPQSFETSEPLIARAEWNNLQPRLTRPQAITPDNANDLDTLYFQGIATNLKPNDPLLLVFEAQGQQVFRRVKAVETQAAEDRTKVILQEEVTPAEPAEESFDASAIAKVAERYATAELKIHRVSATSEMAQRVILHLTALSKHEQAAGITAESAEQAVREMLAKIAEEKEVAVGEQYTRLASWLTAMTHDLDEAARVVRLAVAMRAKRLAATAVGPSAGEGQVAPGGLGQLIAPLTKAASIQPANSLRLERSVTQTFSAGSDIGPRLLTTLEPALRPTLYTAWQNLAVTPPSEVKIYALRVTASVFGHNASKRVRITQGTGEVTVIGDWPIIEEPYDEFSKEKKRIIHEETNAVHLDASYDKILPDSWLVVETPDTRLTDENTLIAKARKPNAALSRAKYGLTGKTTRIELALPSDPSVSVEWITADLDKIDLPSPTDDDFEAIRRTVVYAQSEELTLAEEPIDPVEGAICSDRIELGSLYDGLESGRWLIVSGERADIPGTTGVMANELVMLAGVEQGFAELPGDKTHSTLILAEDLAYCYRLDTVKIYGNVVKATHGETRSESLGSGDGSKALQSFTLKQPPLTYVSAPNPSGVESTLQVRVNDILWHEADSLAGLGPTDRGYITKTDDESKTTVIFGNGYRGARLPTGVENVKSVYRNGIGKPGNVEAGQVSLLVTRPLNVKEVINPLPATGGADRDSRDQARRNAPLAVMALDRLVSLQDYADFARTFAGIGKASAARLSDGRRELVHLTIAGAGDVPIDENSDLYRNLRQALRQFGDPYQPFQVDVRELLLLVISAKVRLLPDYQWESVEPKIRAALLDTFSFERRELGQDVLSSEVISTIQRVPGVAYVDVDILDHIPETIEPEKLDSLATTLTLEPRIPVEIARTGPIRPAQLAYLSPEVPDTLILTEITV